MRRLLGTFVALAMIAGIAAATGSSWAMTLATATQAVRDFEDDQNLQVEADLSQTVSDLSGVYEAWVTVNTDPLLRHSYYLEDSTPPVVVDALYADWSFLNSSRSGTPISEAQGETVAESYATDHYPPFSQETWTLAIGGGQTGTVYHYYKTLGNGAKAYYDGCKVEVDLGTGHVAWFSYTETGYSASAEQTPQLSAAQADAAAKQAYSILSTYTASSNELIINGDGVLVYRICYPVSSEDKHSTSPPQPDFLEIDANSGSVVFIDTSRTYVGPAITGPADTQPAAPSSPNSLGKVMLGAFVAVLKVVASLF